MSSLLALARTTILAKGVGCPTVGKMNRAVCICWAVFLLVSMACMACSFPQTRQDDQNMEFQCGQNKKENCIVGVSSN